MAKGAPDSQGGGGDTSIGFLWVAAAIIIFAFLIWTYGKVYITSTICSIRYYEIVGIKYILNTWITVTKEIPLLDSIVPNLSRITQWETYTKESFGFVDPKIIKAMSVFVGNYLRIPCVIILGLLTFYVYFTSATYRFQNIFNLKSLKTLERKNWPQISPVVNLELQSTPLDAAPWAMALSPMNFCKKHNLIKVEKDNKGLYKTSLVRGAAYRILSLQLGPRWRQPEDLPMYLQALFAIFAARINNDKKAADALVLQLAASSTSGRLNFSGVSELVAKHKNAKPVQRVIAIHAYVTTVMASLLSSSREAGVLATSEFIWLKPMDRRIWYILNSVGRPTAFAEISGTFAHWLAEKKLGLPLNVPMVDEAVIGLDLALKDILYKPDEE